MKAYLNLRLRAWLNKFIKKIFFRVTILSILGLLPVWSMASEMGEKEPEALVKAGSVFGKTYNAAYGFINDHEYLLPPASGFMAGMATCGPWCGAAGAVAGAADECLVRYGYIDRHYLTWGIFGMATGQVISPSLGPQIAGAVLGILMPLGTLNNHSEMIAPVTTALAGNAIAGVPGLIVGGVGGGIDELLFNKEIIDKHYLTFSALGMAAAKTTNLLGTAGLLDRFNPPNHN